MSVTARLSLTNLAVAQNDKELTINGNMSILDNAALVTIANTFSRAPDATTQHGNINIGDGGFTGGAGHYVGGAGGSLLAINLVSGGTADLLNLQINGVSKWKVGSGGNATYGEGSNIVVGTATGSQIGTSSSQKLVLWGGTPVVRPASNAELRASLIAIGAITGGVNDLNTNGGNLIANACTLSGALQGSGTALQVRRLQFTFASDANDALDASEKGSVIIEIVTGVISATRVLDLVTPNAGGVWLIHNGEAFPVTLKIGAGTGITVASHRSRLLYTTGGVNVFSAGPDQDYSV